MDTGLQGKVALVTGAGRVGGIGAATAKALAAEGARVVLSDIGRPLGLGLVPVTEITVEAWHQNLDVMALGTMLGIREGAKAMIAGGDGGAIVNVASQAGKTGWPLLGAYCAAKFAVLGLTQVAAKELGAHGITVNAVCPGTVETPLLDVPGGLWETYTKAAGKGLDELKQDVLAQIPLGRFQTAEDVADAILFLASEQGRYVTGEALNASGGQEMH